MSLSRKDIKPLISRNQNLEKFKKLGGSLLDAKSEEEYLSEAQTIIQEHNLLPHIQIETTPEREPKLEPIPFKKKKRIWGK